MRLFVAAWPSPAVLEQLALIDRPPRPGIRWTPEDQWHVTLRFLGEIGGEDVDRVKAALDQLGSAGAGGPVTAVAGPALERLGQSVLCLPVAGLDELTAAVVALTSEFGVPVEDRSFRGHLTIARAGRAVNPRQPVPVPFSAAWEVEEVTLVASTLRPTGARYEVIGRYRLDG
ncbi:MAG: RNA 2',3'-cyclic phosphodiesterase [Actinomycetota bacterium]|nr:RNA 2',3'-cyclic phosphodiesterase [Actinomycetota bacterium]